MDDTGDHHQERGVRIRRRHPTLIPKTDQHATAAEGIRPVRAADGKSKAGTLQQALLHPRRIWSGIRRRNCWKSSVGSTGTTWNSRVVSDILGIAVQFPRNEEFLHLRCQQDRVTADQYFRPTLLSYGCHTYSRSWRMNY